MEAFPRWDGPLAHPAYSRGIKRALDVCLALLLLAPAVLMMLPIALAVKLTSPGPVFYTAPRGGYHNRPFTILKFRTMVKDADRYSSTTALNDPRVTPVGRFLRRTKLDEFPQLFNVLKGDMSFVGPRPELLRYTTRYAKEEECILWVRPGITDPSSIRLIRLNHMVGHDDPEGVYERDVLPIKNRMRAEYALSQSFGLDVKIFCQTICCVIRNSFCKE